MRLALFDPPSGGATLPGVLTEGGVVDISSATADSPRIRPSSSCRGSSTASTSCGRNFERLAADATPLPLDIVRLRPPLPRPGKILCCIGNYWEHDQRERRAR